MAKKDLLEEAQAAGLVSDDTTPDDYTEAQLKAIVDPASRPAWEGSLSSKTPIVAPDGHVNLSQDDIDNAAA